MNLSLSPVSGLDLHVPYHTQKAAPVMADLTSAGCRNYQEPLDLARTAVGTKARVLKLRKKRILS